MTLAHLAARTPVRTLAERSPTELLATAHQIAKAHRHPGDCYAVTFSAALRWLHQERRAQLDAIAAECAAADPCAVLASVAGVAITDTHTEARECELLTKEATVAEEETETDYLVGTYLRDLWTLAGSPSLSEIIEQLPPTSNVAAQLGNLEHVDDMRQDIWTVGEADEIERALRMIIRSR